MEAENQEEPRNKKSENQIIKKISKNYWIAISAVLAVLLVVSLLAGGITGSTITGSVIKDTEAGEKIMEFAQAQGIPAELIDVNDIGGLYEVNLLIQGQPTSVYLTKDGKYFGSMTLIDQVADQQQQTQEPQEIPKSDKPKVELFVMTHCPYGTQAEKGLIPVIEKLGNKADIKIRFVHYFMHEPEKTETPTQVCIRQEQSSKYLNYLKCFLEDGDSGRCLTKTGIDKTKLGSCISNKAEDYYAEDSELSQQYGVSGSPTLVINGVIASSARSPSAYLQTICSAFNQKPEECNAVLSSQTPISMWGWDESGAADTGAQC